ncbi:MAG: hypothetical protein O7A04_05540 [Acidobacteria bacterium]|nr:hypothetical protein [Acidobacteriota bacterium]
MLFKKTALLLLGVIAAFVAWTWWHSDARRIGRRLECLTESVEKSPGEGPLAAALKAEQVGRLFAEPFEFRARQFDFETRDRQALIRAVVLYRLRSERIVSRILDKRLDVDSAGRKATMVFTARFVGGWSGIGNDAYRFQLNWVEQQGEWKIEYVDLLEIVPATTIGL